MLAIPIIMLLYYDNGPLLSFHYSFIHNKKKNTLSHVYCYPIWKYFYYCDIKYFHFILRMQTKTHFTIIISIKKRRKLKGRVKSDSWTITVKVYNNTQYYTLTQACLTFQSAKYLLEESCDFPLMHFEEERKQNTAGQHFSRRAVLRAEAQ